MGVKHLQLGLARWILLSILITSVIAKCTKKCSNHRTPVCGSDGQTYKNQCKLENRACSRPNLYLLSQGDCNLQGCRRTCVGAPAHVCGTDGVTYNSLCALDNAACTDASISLRGHGRCQKEVILTAFGSNFAGSDRNLVFEIEVESAAGSKPVRGRGLWKLGVYGCRYDDGWCDKVNHMPQILSDDQASTPLGAGDKITIGNIRAAFDASMIGCEDLPYICTEFSKGDDPRPDYVLTMPGHFDSAIMCFELPCVPGMVTDPPQPTQACRYECPESGNTVCGSDGVTYATECALDNENRCSEDPTSYLLQRKHYGPCRTGVIIDSVFWSARGSDGTRIELESLIMSNDTGESISGRNLWKMGIYGSRFEDGSGPRLGYVPQLLDEAQASTTFAAGKAIVMSVVAEFDVAAVGCSRYQFLCLEFTKGDSPQPPFPFTGNSGPEENSVFVACKQVPCNGQPQREIPADGRDRVYVSELGWGLKAGSRRSDGDYDVTINLNARILGTGDRVSGNDLVRVGLFGSKNIYGEGERFAFRKQILTRSQSSVSLTPNTNLVIEDIETHFPVTGVGCSEYGYLCAELGRSETTNQDFLLIPESLDISSTDDSILICKEIPCSNPGGQRPGTSGGHGGTAASKTGRVSNLSWNLKVGHTNSNGPSDLIISVTALPHERSDSISGEGLWRVGLYASEDSNPLGRKERYSRQILSREQQSAPLGPNTNLELTEVNTQFDLTGLGCGELNYICLEFTRGDSPEPSFILPLPQEDNDGVTERISSCKAWPWCQGGDTTSHTGGSTSHSSGSTGHESGGTGGSTHTTGGGQEDSLYAAFANVHWGRRLAPDMSGDKNLVMELTPHPLSSAVTGYNLWRVGLFGSDVSDGTGRRFEEIENILSYTDRSKPLVLGKSLDFTIRTPNEVRDMGCRHSYECIEFTKLPDSIPPFKLALGNKDTFVSCQNISCTDAGTHGGGGSVHTGGMGGAGHETGGHGGGTPAKPSTHQPRPTGDAVALHNLRWSRPTISAENPAKVNFRVLLTPKPHSRPIEGFNMWKLSMFGSDDARGTGMKFGVINSILFNGNQNKPVVPGEDMDFEIQRFFNLAKASCSHPYLCLEFSKNAYSTVSFKLDLGADTLVSCKRLTCDDGGEEQGGGNPPDTGSQGGGMGGPTTHGGSNPQTGVRVALSSLRWTSPTTSPENPSVMKFRAMLTPGTHSGSVEGYNMWKMTMFGSDRPDGSQARFGEIGNVLSGENLKKPVVPGQNLEFSVERMFDLTAAGCAHDYLCIEFSKNTYSSVPFSINLGDTETLISCKRLTCDDRGSQTPTNTGHGGGQTPTNTGHGGGNPPQTPGVMVIFSKINWGRLPSNPDRPGNVNLNVTLTPNPHSNPLSGSRLWSVGIFGSDAADGAGTRYQEQPNVLSSRDQNKAVTPTQRLEFDISTPFDFSSIGCVHPYFCIEFGKNRYSSPSYILRLGNKDSLVACQRVSCNPNAGQTPGGHTPGGQTPGGHTRLDPSLPTARFYNISWTPTPGEVRAGRITDLNVRATLFPNPDTDTISGKRLWRIGLYGNMYKDGTGPERIHYNEQILTPKQAKTPLRRNRPVVFDVDTRFPLEGFGCDLHRYLCIEFAQHSQPNPEFNFPIENGAHVSCRPYLCQDSGQPYPEPEPQPEPAPNQNYARVDDFSWKIGNTNMNANGLTDLRVFVNVTPTADTDTISGQNLWRIGVYGSRVREGVDGYQDRYDYNPQILQVHDARRVFGPGRPLKFDVNTRFDMRQLGCGPYKYFCVEFGKDSLAVPDFYMPLSNGDVSVSCQRSVCPEGGSHTGGTDHAQPDPATMKTARFSRMDWRLLGPTVYSHGDSDLRILMDITPNPSSDRIDGGAGSGLWRVGIFGNSNTRGSHPMKINYESQILSLEDRDKSLIPPGHLNFDMTTPFNLRRAHCDSQYPFLCLELSKGERAYPDFNLPFPRGADSYVSCQPAPCLTTDTRTHGTVPVATVTSVTMDGATIQPGIQNNLFLDVSVNMAQSSSNIHGANLWRVEMWASRSSTGEGLKIGHNSQVLSETQTDRSYVPPEPVYFAAVPFSVDMRRKVCAAVGYVCAKFSKQDNAVPEFSLEASPNSNVLTTCRPVDCSTPTNSMITVTGLSLFQMRDVGLRPGRPNTLTIGVRVNYDAAESVGFSGTNLWSLQMWMSAKANGKGNKVSAVNQALDAELSSVPFVLGRDLQFRGVELSVNLMGKRCKAARYVCVTLSKNAGSSESYELLASPTPKSLSKCLPVNCS
ncbi:uncharacterized protein LOC117287759 isoform X2 [Asterias rubens]|uniref:uncharacterized protein LOC117287759 isoform X2 n=1 Tax=Asterias rubens TaxID=7604 RepID=UPI001455759B|nr:uncharacterized protein LOC117287759 isoform X2 [Asterias rubens]